MIHEQLEMLLSKARDALTRFGTQATPANRAMLENLISQAEIVLRGGPLVQTSGSRAFLTMSHEDWCGFIIAHPVMLAFSGRNARI